MSTTTGKTIASSTTADVESKDRPAFLAASSKDLIEPGDLVMVYVNFNTFYPVRVEHGQQLTMRYGALRHDFLIGQPYGSKISATAGYIHVLRPTAELWTRSLSHRTQILYSADVAMICLLLDLKPGCLLAESGTGSGSASHAFARALAPTGRLFTFDIDADRIARARDEFQRNGFDERLVVARKADVCREGFVGVEAGALDAVFLDFPNPWLAVEFAAASLRPLGRFCSFSPCIGQTQRVCLELDKHGFVGVETVELVPRTYKLLGGGSAVGGAGGDEDDDRRETTPKRRKKEKASTKRVRDGGAKAAGRLLCVPSPAQQPTHTGYLTSATFLPEEN